MARRLSRRSRNSLPGWEMSSAWTFCPFIKWGASSGRNSDSNTRLEKQSRRPSSWLRKRARCFAMKDCKQSECSRFSHEGRDDANEDDFHDGHAGKDRGIGEV